MQFFIYILQKSAVHMQIKNIIRIPIRKSRPICNPHISVICRHACQPQACGFQRWTSTPVCDCGEQQTMSTLSMSTHVQSQNWMAIRYDMIEEFNVACWASMKQMRMPSAGWRWRRRRHSRNEMNV